MNRLILFFLFLCIILSKSFSDQSTDIIKETKFSKRINSLIKFRGETYLVFSYCFPYQDGLAENHYSKVNYNTIDYTSSNDSHHSPGEKGRIIGSNRGSVELKLFAKYSLIAPFLSFNNPLLINNNIKFTVYTELSPLSMMAGLGVSITPLPFLIFSSGFKIGSCWDLGSFVSGLGRNNKGDIMSEPFYGALIKIWFAMTLQFDFAFILPKNSRRWMHFVFQADPRITYQSLLNVNENQPYRWEADRGEDLNGWIYEGEYLSGYQIIINDDYIGEDRPFIKTSNKKFIVSIGIYSTMFLRLTHFFDSQISNGGWGSDFCFIDFGPAAKIDLPYNLYITTFLLWKNRIENTQDTVGNLDFQTREYKDWYLYIHKFSIYIGYIF